MARGVGAMAIKGVDKARNAEHNASQRHLVHGKARELDREHDISGKVMEAGSKAECKFVGVDHGKC